MINPAVVEGQVRGGVAQGIGEVLYEQAAYDEDGNFLAGTFMDYLLPTAAEIPAIEIEHLETDPDGEFGFRGVGEGGAVVAPATLTNAIEDALAALRRPGDRAVPATGEDPRARWRSANWVRADQAPSLSSFTNREADLEWRPHLRTATPGVESGAALHHLHGLRAASPLGGGGRHRAGPSSQARHPRGACRGGQLGGGSSNTRTAQGRALRSCSCWTWRTSGAWGRLGFPARDAKKPATYAANSAGIEGATTSGAGPSSTSRLGSQNAMSTIGLPTQAKFQSTRTARPATTQRLSLRTSLWSSAPPRRGAREAAASSTGPARVSQAGVHTPSRRNSAG